MLKHIFRSKEKLFMPSVHVHGMWSFGWCVNLLKLCGEKMIWIWIKKDCLDQHTSKCWLIRIDRHWLALGRESWFPWVVTVTGIPVARGLALCKATPHNVPYVDGLKYLIKGTTQSDVTCSMPLPVADNMVNPGFNYIYGFASLQSRKIALLY